MSVEARGNISHLALYPVKSAARLELPQARLTESGLETVESGLKDHDFMVVSAVANEQGVFEFVQQRQRGMNVMTQIRPHFEAGALSLSWGDQDTIAVPLDYDKGIVIPVKVWDDVCQAMDQGDELASWFSDHLSKPVRLVRAVGESFQRQARQSYLENDNQMRFQDGYPIHWFPQEDVSELEKKAGVELGWERFRPQIVAEGFEPQFVHAIFGLNVAGIPCDQPKPCERCPIPQIDQDTGEKSGEPNRTLMKYKVWRNKHGDLNPIFGENINPHGEGVVQVGDEVEVTSLRPEGLVYGSYQEMKKQS